MNLGYQELFYPLFKILEDNKTHKTSSDERIDCIIKGFNEAF